MPFAFAVAGAVKNLIATLEVGVKGPTIDDCVAMAWKAFHALFRDKILDLTDKFPADATDSKGEPFWSGHKRFPAPATFDSANEEHVAFMIAATNLFASMLKVHPTKPPSELNDPSRRWQAEYRSVSWLLGAIDRLGGPPPRTTGAVDMEGEEGGGDTKRGGGGKDDAAAAAEKELEELLARVSAMGASATPSAGFEPADFEKDDDDNFHIDFVTACSNLRAANYHIPIASRHKCKMIAGRIIPAIATTTASVTGMVMLEMFKVLMSKPVEQLRNGNYDLGSNQYMLFEADPPKQIADHVRIDKPDPKQHPDAYDEKGELVDMYKDPDMMLGFAERIKTHPNPHTKYDKVWVGPLSAGATLGELKSAIDSLYADAGLKVSMITAPTQRVECDKSEENPNGLRTGGRSMWNANLSGTRANLEKPWVALLKALTTRDDATWPTVDEPVDVSNRLLYADLVVGLQDDDGDDVVTPPIVIKLKTFDFVSYKDRVPRAVAPWLADYVASKKQRT